MGSRKSPAPRGYNDDADPIISPRIDASRSNTSALSPAIKHAIADEVNRQISAANTQLMADIIADLKFLEKSITQDIMTNVQRYLDKELSKRNTMPNPIPTATVEDMKADLRAELKREVDTMNNQIVLANNRQLTMTKQMTKDLTTAVVAATTKQVYQTVISEINTKVVPKINDMVAYVNYQTQDTSELITDYRRAVELDARYERAASDTKLLTSSKQEDKKSWAGGAVRIMWDEDDVVT